MQRYARKRLQEEQEIKELVKQVADGHKNSKAAKVKLQELKQRIGTRKTTSDLLFTSFYTVHSLDSLSPLLFAWGVL